MSQTCAFCGAQDDRHPLIAAQFEGEPLWICPGCVPGVIHPKFEGETAERIRAARKARAGE